MKSWVGISSSESSSLRSFLFGDSSLLDIVMIGLLTGCSLIVCSYEKKDNNKDEMMKTTWLRLWI